MMDVTHQRVLKANQRADLRHSASSISQIPTAFFISKMIYKHRQITPITLFTSEESITSLVGMCETKCRTSEMKVFLMQEVLHGDPTLHFIPLWKTPYNKIKGNIKMKQITILSLLMLTINLLISATLEVAIDGTKPYTSIQTAINASTNGDVIQVYPGIYRENVNFNHKSVILQSLYAVNPDTMYIHNTQIIGQYTQPAITAEDYISVTINGFTIMNNENEIDEYVPWVGGGIFVHFSNAVIKNNIITKCMMGDGGGGISTSAGPNDNFSVFLENNQIFNNKAFRVGGGLVSGRGVNVTFSNTHRNSIYLNRATYGKDISIGNPRNNIAIYLKKGSRQLSDLDQVFVYEYYSNINYPDVNVSLDIEEGIYPSIDHDLYVAPWGNDSNNGLSPESPLKTIDYATRIIKANPNHPNTIYLAEGTYSRSLNQQEFPIALPPYTNFKGAGMHQTILDDEHRSAMLSAINDESNYQISDFSVINCGNEQNTSYQTIGIKCKTVDFKNIKLSNHNSRFPGLLLTVTRQAKIKNVLVQDNTSNFDSKGLYTNGVDTLMVDNYITDNNHGLSQYGGATGMSLIESKSVFMNNCSVTNSSAFDPGLFKLTNYDRLDPYDEPGLCVINNMLIANNNTSVGDWDLAKCIIYDDYNQVILNNWTIANNRGNSIVMSVAGNGATMNNMIFYNPEMPYELALGSELTPYIPVVMNNSLLYGGVNRVKFYLNNQNYLTLNECITGNPLFRGMSDSSLNMSMPEYYELSPLSDCINSGVADTSGTYLCGSDLAGNQRVWDGRVDMGCYEYGAPIPNEPELPAVTDYQLCNYPNPVIVSSFPFTSISFNYPEKASAEPVIEIYNIKGQKVRTLRTGESFLDLAIQAKVSKEALSNIKGREYSVSWDIRDEHKNRVPSGVYFYCAKINGRVIQTKKMLVLK